MADKLQTFKWIGITHQGKRASGTMKLANIKLVYDELKKMGIEAISVKPVRTIALFAKTKKIKTKNILLFTRYFSTMLAAGLPVVKALDIISHDQDNVAMQTVVLTIKNNVSSGKTLTESFSQFPQYFNELYCNLIHAGEKSGTLDKILKRLAAYLERSDSLKRKIRKALVYPIAVVIVATVVSFVLLFFVVPKFEDVFASFGAKLPFFTLMVIDFSKMLREYWWIFFACILFFIWAFRYAIKRNKSFERGVDKGILKIYVVGSIIKRAIIARFTRTLATTLEAGTPIIDSMTGMTNLMGNVIYAEGLQQICRDVANGNPLSQAMESTKLFPNMVIQMITVGEISGSLSEMLYKIADYYEEEVNEIVDNLSSLLEPIILVILGVIIGGFIIAMYLPIFKLGSLYK